MSTFADDYTCLSLMFFSNTLRMLSRIMPYTISQLPLAEDSLSTSIMGHCWPHAHPCGRFRSRCFRSWSATTRLLLPAAAMAAATNLLLFHLGPREFRATVPSLEAGETASMSRKYMQASVSMLLIFQRPGCKKYVNHCEEQRDYRLYNDLQLEQSIFEHVSMYFSLDTSCFPSLRVSGVFK